MHKLTAAVATERKRWPCSTDMPTRCGRQPRPSLSPALENIPHAQPAHASRALQQHRHVHSASKARRCLINRRPRHLTLSRRRHRPPTAHTCTRPSSLASPVDSTANLETHCPAGILVRMHHETHSRDTLKCHRPFSARPPYHTHTHCSHKPLALLTEALAAAGLRIRLLHASHTY